MTKLGKFNQIIKHLGILRVRILTDSGEEIRRVWMRTKTFRKLGGQI